jgi:DnaJ homolog subfamily C member 9
MRPWVLPLSEHAFSGSSEEIDDIMDAYIAAGGSVGDIMDHIPHSTHDDEPRFIILISDLISNGALPALPSWESSVKDEKSRLVRQKQGRKEAAEAEELARELGVWDEFYGGGKPAEKKGRGKEKNRERGGEEADDHSALQALIVKKRKDMDGFFDGLAAKYAQPQSSSKPKGGRGKKRAEADSSQGEILGASSNKKSRRAPTPPDIDDEEFEMLQQKLFGDKLDDAFVPDPKTTTGRSRRVK